MLPQYRAACAREELDRIDRAVLRMESVLGRIDPDGAFPAPVAALLAAPLPAMDLRSLTPAELSRLAGLIDRYDAVISDVSARQRRVAGRLNAVRSARRAAILPALVDRLG